MTAKAQKAGKEAPIPFLGNTLSETKSEKLHLKFNARKLEGSYLNEKGTGLAYKDKPSFTIASICEVIYKPTDEEIAQAKSKNDLTRTRPYPRVAVYKMGNHSIWADELGISTRKKDLQAEEYKAISYRTKDVVVYKSEDPTLFEYLTVCQQNAASPYRKQNGKPATFSTYDPIAVKGRSVKAEQIETEILSVWDSLFPRKGNRTEEQSMKLGFAMAVASTLGIDIERPSDVVMHDIRTYIKQEPYKWAKAIVDPTNATYFVVDQCIKEGIISFRGEVNAIFKGTTKLVAAPQGADVKLMLAKDFATPDGQHAYQELLADLKTRWGAQVASPIFNSNALDTLEQDARYLEILEEIN